MGKLLCHRVGEVVKILRGILGKRELIVLHWARIGSRFLLSYGRFDGVY
jgi:hypothetical protein